MNLASPAAKIALPILILVGGFAVNGFLSTSGPEAEKGERYVSVTEVDVMTAEVVSHTVTIAASGEVEPRRRSRISAEVSGVLTVPENVEVGHVFSQGDVMLTIQDDDYRAAVVDAQSALTQAEVELSMEEARASQAARDWEKLGDGREPDALVLREPQLAAAKARLDAAAARRDRAQRDLERTQIRAPYDCRVVALNADEGAIATPTAPLIEVESANDYEVRLPISLDDYRFLRKQEDGEIADTAYTLRAPALAPAAVWKGESLRSESLIAPTTRSLNIVAAVPAVAENGQTRIYSGTFVEAEIAGRTLDEVFVLPRRAFVDREQILLLTADDTLAFHTVSVLRYEGENVIVDGGLEAGARVVVSSLDSPIEGSSVQVREPAAEVTP